MNQALTLSIRGMRTILRPIRAMRHYMQLPNSAKSEVRTDNRRVPVNDPGIEKAIVEGMAWLSRAQDHSASHDGGVARHFSLITGWGTSYPETTGYIVPTMLMYAKLSGDEEIRQRAKRMLDWLVSIQLPNGGFQGGPIDAKPIVPVTFNTGQILLGLAAGVEEWGEDYRPAMLKAADWLVETQDSDGCWRRFGSPFAGPGEKTYETHVAWGLFEAARLEPKKLYGKAALANVNWALSAQRDNGWFDFCCLDDRRQPLTHTLGYALRGIVEAFRFSRDECFIQAARKTADGLLTAIQKDGFLPGRLDANWSGAVEWACLTGTVQIASCWLMLYQETGDVRYRDAAYAGNRYVRRTMKIDGPPETRGAIKGSFPVNGGYGSYEYLNWACKFFIDSNMTEQIVRADKSAKLC